MPRLRVKLSKPTNAERQDYKCAQSECRRNLFADFQQRNYYPKQSPLKESKRYTPAASFERSYRETTSQTSDESEAFNELSRNKISPNDYGLKKISGSIERK